MFMTSSVAKPFGFSKAEHLRSGADFRRVYEARRSVADSRLIIYACFNHLPHTRIGFSVSRKVGNAVRRNRLRRLYREAFRLTKTDLPKSLDLVLIPRGADEPSLVDLKRSLLHLANQLAQRLAREAKS
jgi:ribonuclease P protein component